MFDPTRLEVIQLVQAAVQAPSADNRHHVVFDVGDGFVELRADEHFVECDVPHRRTLTLLSYGAVVENLRLALSRHGWTFRPVWCPAPDDPALLLRIDWAELQRGDIDPLAAHIRSRHTNRERFRGPILSAPERDAIEAAARSVDGIDLRWCDSRKERSALLELMRAAETERFRIRRHHAELFESVAFEAGWHESPAEKLAPGALGVEWIMRSPFKALRHWSLMHLATKVGAHKVLGFRAGDFPARWAPHLVVMTSTLAGDLSALEGGRAFQRLWLTAESLGLALQPMVAAAVLVEDQEPGTTFRTALAERLERGWRTLIVERRPVVVFRLGRGTRPRVVSGRRPAATYLATSSTSAPSTV